MFSAEGWSDGVDGENDGTSGGESWPSERGTVGARKGEESTAAIDSGGSTAMTGPGSSREETSLSALLFSVASWAGGVIGENDGPRGGVL